MRLTNRYRDVIIMHFGVKFQEQPNVCMVHTNISRQVSSFSVQTEVAFLRYISC